MKLIDIGIVARPHGLKGAFVLGRDGGPDSSIATLDAVYLEKESLSGPFAVLEASKLAKGWKVHLAGFSSIESIECFRGAAVRIDQATMMPLSPNQFRVEDLVGMATVENGVLLGAITGIEFLTGAADRWWIRHSSGSDFSIPATKAHIVSVDIATRTLTVRNTEQFR